MKRTSFSLALALGVEHQDDLGLVDAGEMDEGRFLEDAQAAHDPDMLAARLAENPGEDGEAVQFLEMRLAARDQALGVLDAGRADGKDLGVLAQQSLVYRRLCGHPVRPYQPDT